MTRIDIPRIHREEPPMEENLIPSLDIPRIQQQEPPMEENLIKQVPLNEKFPLAKEEFPPTLSQEKRPGRRVALVSGCLVTILALFWWYQPSQLLSGSQMRTREESVVREKNRDQMRRKEVSRLYRKLSSGKCSLPTSLHPRLRPAN